MLLTHFSHQIKSRLKRVRLYLSQVHEYLAGRERVAADGTEAAVTLNHTSCLVPDTIPTTRTQFGPKSQHFIPYTSLPRLTYIDAD